MAEDRPAYAPALAEAALDQELSHAAYRALALCFYELLEWYVRRPIDWPTLAGHLRVDEAEARRLVAVLVDRGYIEQSGERFRTMMTRNKTK